eukprot:5311116-Amphidinium_carterae.1
MFSHVWLLTLQVRNELNLARMFAGTPTMENYGFPQQSHSGGILRHVESKQSAPQKNSGDSSA